MKNFSFNKLTKLEIITSLVLVIYLFVDIETPLSVKKVIGSKYGLGLLGLILVLVVCYSNPLVTILLIFAMYELVRKVTDEGFEEMEEELEEIDEAEEDMEEEGEADALVEAPELFTTDEFLENNIIREMAPVGKGNKIEYKNTSYKPVEVNLTGTSLVM
tara:strand:+ start:1397 stop:1876 length:480 start_codon:yes stop_codon:yes gene_type:complete